MKKFDVISIGSAIRDIFIKNRDLKCSVDDVCHPFNQALIGEKISVKRMYFDIGGGGSNSAATFARMGLKVGLMSRIGKDLAGKEVLRVMKEFKVDRTLVEVSVKEETGYSVIFLNKDGERTALTFRGAADFNQWGKIKPDKLNTNWFFITSLSGNIKLIKELFGVAKKKGIKVAWNPGDAELSQGFNKLRGLLKQSEVVVLNLREAKLVTKVRSNEIKNILAKMGKICPKGVICITQGSKGAWAMSGREIYWAKTLDKKVVNATGAGDAFGSGLVAGLILYRDDIVRALQLAMLNSNGVVTKMGAKHGLLSKPPTKKMLDKIRLSKVK